jgi:hypothetical protein
LFPFPSQPPIRLNSLEKDESRKSEINDKSFVENESPQIKSEEQNIIVDKESERSENIDNKEIKKSAYNVCTFGLHELKKISP